MHENMHSFNRTYKLTLFANQPPKINRGEDDPVWNRVLADCWRSKIENPIAEGLIDEIYDKEAEGILADMVRGWTEFFRQGMKLLPPASIQLSTEQYQQAESPLAAFLVKRSNKANRSR